MRHAETLSMDPHSKEAWVLQPATGVCRWTHTQRRRGSCSQPLVSVDGPTLKVRRARARWFGHADRKAPPTSSHDGIIMGQHSSEIGMLLDGNAQAMPYVICAYKTFINKLEFAFAIWPGSSRPSQIST